MDKTKTKQHGALKRKLIQLYAAVLYNCYARGFLKGSIYTGKTKFLCVPGLNCYSCPGAIGACPLGSLQNAIAASNAKVPAYMLGILLLYGLLLGRTICGWLCPMGLIQELCYKTPTPKVKKGRMTRTLSGFKYFILLTLVIVIPLWYSYQMLPLPAFCKYICPAGTLEGAICLLENPANRDKLSMLNVLFTNKFIILAVFLCASVFIYRFFCRFLCPLGAIYGLFAKVAVIGVKVERSACTDCGRCVSRCKMDIRRVGDRECIHCGECIDVCPTGAVSLKAGKIVLRSNEGLKSQEKILQMKGNKKMKKWLLSICLLAVLAGMITFVHLNDPAQAQSDAASKSTQAPAYSVDESVAVGMEVGMRAPDFTAELYGSGEEFVLSEHLGQTVVVNFWATWCTPCCLELPHFDAVYTENGGEVAVIALHSDLVTDDVDAYLARFEYQLPFGLDADGSIISSFGGSTMLPQTVIIDKNGVITYNAVGSMTYEKLKGLVEESFKK